MGIFSKENEKQLKDVLKKMNKGVNIVYFTQEYECGACRDTRNFISEFSELSKKINLHVRDFEKDKEEAAKYGVDKIPAIVILDEAKNDLGIKYYGPPAGYEINSFIVTLLEVSGVEESLDATIEKRIKAIDKDIHIQVFVSLQCPYCPGAVIAGHKLAFLNSKIKGDMIETSVFPHVANKYNVAGVPRVVINENKILEGAQPIEKFLEVIEEL